MESNINPIMTIICCILPSSLVLFFTIGKMKSNQENIHEKINAVKDDTDKKIDEIKDITDEIKYDIKRNYTEQSIFKAFENNICTNIIELNNSIKEHREMLANHINRMWERELEREHKDVARFDKMNQTLSGLKSDLAAIGIIKRRENDDK